MKCIINILLLLLLSITVYAQRAPITVTTILTPPYTTSLSTMAESGSTRLMVNLLVNDVTITELPVKLHIKMESSGITIESIPTQTVAPMFLGGGEARVLTGDDFAQYFNLNNLNFKGFSKEAYIKNGQLPAGLWKFSVSVRHFYTNKTISNIGTVTAWITSYKPPVLTSPKEGENAPSNAALPLTFSWQASKHTGGTSAIMYRFEMWERRIEGVPAQTVAASVPPIYTTETAGRYVEIMPATLALEPDMKYCWRVTAYDPSGMVTIENNGESEVRTFQYLEKCPEVCGLTVDIKDDTGYASWEENRMHLGGYNFEFYDDEGTCHKTLWGSSTKTVGIGGEYGKTWHVRVQGLCRSGVEGPWSDWVDFKIPDAFKPLKDENGNTYGCGREVPERVITNFELIDNIQKGDTLEDERGTTKYIVHSAIKNEDGSFRGLSYMKLSFWGVKVLGEYNNMKVNTDGVIIGRYAWQSVKSDLLVADPEDIEKWADELALEMAGATYNNTIKDTIVLKYSRGIVPFETIAREGTKYYAVTSDGHKEEITSFINGRKRVMVKDGDGHELVIDKDGNVMGVEEYRASGGNEQLLKTFNAKKDSLMSTTDNITFEKVETENYGFDKWRGEEYDRNQYPTITDNNDYRPAYIGAEKEKTIRIKVNKTKGITFKSERGVPLIANEKDNTIAFNCGTTGRQAIYAYRDSTVVGKVNVQAYSYKDVKVHLVRVNGATKRLDVEAITKGVNEIFDDAVVRYTFDELDLITINYANKKHFVHGGKGTFQNYNEDQKTAIKALPETADQNDYYLFFVECFDRLDTAGNVSKEAVNGYMPVGRHYGFIYNEYTNARTIAHELAHGTNALHHTFSPESESFYTTKETDNLMDYHGGEYLNHRQWQWSHEKHRNVLGFLDDEGESEMRENINDKILSILKEIREANQKNEATLNISINHSMTYSIDAPNVNFLLGEGKLSYLKIENDKLHITETEMTIAAYELSEVALEDNEYIKIVFHKTTSVGISEDVAFSIIVKTNEKQTLINYIRPYKITTKQLSNIYPDASMETIKAVTEAINKYCNDFEINTSERMAHFLGQIGAETGSKLNQLSENSKYSARRIVEIFGYTKYGHLFEVAELNPQTYNYTYTPINYSCMLCADGAIDKNGSSFSLSRSEIINAYAEKKVERDVIVNGMTTKKMLFRDVLRTDVTASNISSIVKKAIYNEGRLRIKTQYINSETLFDVTYACRMGNGAIETRDGSIYKGVGFIHLTGKSNYKCVVDEWNRMYPEDQLTLNHELIERAKTDVDLAMKLAMAYWKKNGLNSYIDDRKEINNNDILKISAIVNVGHIRNITESDINGYYTRKNATIKSYNVLNEK